MKHLRFLIADCRLPICGTQSALASFFKCLRRPQGQKSTLNNSRRPLDIKAVGDPKIGNQKSARSEAQIISGTEIETTSRFIGNVLLFLLLLGLSGCTMLKDGKPPGAWHEAYLPIEDPESVSFVSNALEQAVAEFGQPVIPVNKVLLRRTTKSEAAMGYAVREDFSLTECVDSTNGIFVIYVGVDQDHRNYYGLLGHECAHLLNPFITDWYMEGTATVFSEEVCAALGKEWGSWSRHFKKSRRDPYAVSYQMMREMKAAFPEEYPRMQRFVRSNGYDGGWQQIHIDGWLSILPDERRHEALGIIEPRVNVLERQVNQMYSFEVPEALGRNAGH